MVSDAQWTIQIANGRIVYIDGATLDPTYMGDGDLSNLVYTVSYVNEALYELPSTGSFGIYVPMFSGVVMMMAAAFILMTAKRREA